MPMISYRVDVRPIFDEVGCSIDISDSIDIPTLAVGDIEFALVEPVALNISLSNAGAGFVAHGTASAHVRVACSRCLCDYEDTLRGEVVGFYLRSGEPMEGEEEAEQVAGDGSVDLGPAITAALVIEAPFVPLHDPECKGLCPECGKDLNVETCHCEHEHGDDHPFSALESLLHTEQDGETQL